MKKYTITQAQLDALKTLIERGFSNNKTFEWGAEDGSVIIDFMDGDSHSYILKPTVLNYYNNEDEDNIVDETITVSESTDSEIEDFMQSFDWTD